MVHMETRNLRKTRQGVVISNKIYGNPSSVEDKEMEISSNRRKS